MSRIKFSETKLTKLDMYTIEKAARLAQRRERSDPFVYMWVRSQLMRGLDDVFKVIASCEASLQSRGQDAEAFQ